MKDVRGLKAREGEESLFFGVLETFVQTLRMRDWIQFSNISISISLRLVKAQ